ncbi:MAG: P-loop NTPase [Nanoarchaeota archaeon]|nr:P-loop NTPase [Nanoarchaeota archaeon]
MTRFIGVASGKGGVGRTTVAINLASALSKLGKRVVLVDAHLNSPHVALSLGAHSAPKTIHHAIQRMIHIREAGYKHHSGLTLIPGSISKDMQEETCHYNVMDVLHDLIDTCEIVVCDMGSENIHNVMRAMDSVLVVATPDMLSVAECIKTISNTRELGREPLGIILNRIQNESYEIKDNNIETLTGLKIIARLPETKDVKKALKYGMPVVHLHPGCEISKNFIQLAKIIQ